MAGELTGVLSGPDESYFNIPTRNPQSAAGQVTRALARVRGRIDRIGGLADADRGARSRSGGTCWESAEAIRGHPGRDILCIFAWHCWRRGEERDEMFGMRAEGYVVPPKGLGPLLEST